VRKADNLPPSCAVVTKSGSLNFLEPSGPLRACNGTALPFYGMYVGFSANADCTKIRCSYGISIMRSEIKRYDKTDINHSCNSN